MDKLTPKQEAFCQAYVRLSDKTAAYREAYNTSKMSDNSVYQVSCRLARELKVSSRIAEIRSEIKTYNAVTIAEIIETLGLMLRFDIGQMYNPDGTLKPLNEMPKEARLMIFALDTDEITKMGVQVGFTKKVKTYSKIDAIDKLLRHLGGYQKDNEQSKPDVVISNTVDVSKLSSQALLELKNAAKPTDG